MPTANVSPFATGRVLGANRQPTAVTLPPAPVPNTAGKQMVTDADAEYARALQMAPQQQQAFQQQQPPPQWNTMQRAMSNLQQTAPEAYARRKQMQQQFGQPGQQQQNALQRFMQMRQRGAQDPRMQQMQDRENQLGYGNQQQPPGAGNDMWRFAQQQQGSAVVNQ